MKFVMFGVEYDLITFRVEQLTIRIERDIKERWDGEIEKIWYEGKWNQFTVGWSISKLIKGWHLEEIWVKNRENFLSGERRTEFRIPKFFLMFHFPPLSHSIHVPHSNFIFLMFYPSFPEMLIEESIRCLIKLQLKIASLHKPFVIFQITSMSFENVKWKGSVRLWCGKEQQSWMLFYPDEEIACSEKLYNYLYGFKAYLMKSIHLIIEK